MTIQAALSRNPLFKGVNGCELTNLLSQGREKALARKSAFFVEGDPAARCFLLIAGQVKVTQVSADGLQVAARVIGPGEIFGWAGVMGGTDYPGAAEALTDCRAFYWETALLQRSLVTAPQLAVNLLGLMGTRLREAEDRLKELATGRVDQRIASALLRLTGGVANQSLPLARQDLAEVCGTTLYTVSRTLTAWEQAGWVRLGRQSVQILIPQALSELVN
jgi:CRP-like cAMP-binding protein